MKKILCAVLCCMMLFCTVSPSFSEGEPDSARESWYCGAVVRVTGEGIFTGTTGTALFPSTKMSRAMFAVTAARIANADTSGYTALPFTDVPAGRWYTTSVTWACANSLLTPAGDGVFSPAASITGEQLSVTLYKFNMLFGKGLAELYAYSPFGDIGSIAGWAGASVEYMKKCGAASGQSGKMFASGEERPKSEVASALVSFMSGYDSASADTAVHVSSLSLDKRSATLQARSTDALAAVLLPEGAADRSVTWSSSNPDAATVSPDGIVTGVAAGFATITATANDGGLNACCAYTITPAPEPDPVPVYEPVPGGNRNIDPSRPMLALTFDDGPGAGSSSILDTLAAYGAAATFFDQGKNVERYPDIVQREVAVGCEIGSHSYDHPNLRNISYDEIRSQIDRTNNAFIAAVGYAPTLMRPPYGARNDTVDAAVNMKIILWSIDTLDWKTRSADATYNSVMNSAYDGAIVLMHSLYDSTAQAVARIVPALINQGYQLVTVSELAYYKGYTMVNGSHYGSFK